MLEPAITLPLREVKLIAKVAHAAAVEHPSKVGSEAIEAIRLVSSEIKQVEDLAS